MDHRSGSTSQGTSPLKAAGFLVGLLVVVALAFALGMKAGRELDVLRPDRATDTVRLHPDAKPDSAGPSATRHEDPASKRADTVGRPSAGTDAADAKHEGPAQLAKADLHPAGGTAAPARVGDERAAAATAGSEPAPTSTSKTEPSKTEPAAPLPGPDYTIFRSAPGSASVAKPAPDVSGTSVPSSGAPEASSSAKAARTSETPKSVKDPKVATAKPAVPPAPAKSGDSRNAPSGSAQLKIAPDAPTAADKASAASPGFVVQVAALNDRVDADQLATRLKAHGVAGYVTKVDLPTGTWYRVRVGKFKTTAEAKAAQKKLAAEGFGGAEVMSAR